MMIFHIPPPSNGIKPAHTRTLDTAKSQPDNNLVRHTFYKIAVRIDFCNVLPVRLAYYPTNRRLKHTFIYLAVKCISYPTNRYVVMSSTLCKIIGFIIIYPL
ncbi:unnamed protein product [Brassica oleracea]